MVGRRGRLARRGACGGSTCCAAGCTPTRRPPRWSSTAAGRTCRWPRSISGVVEPPGPDEVRALVDEVLGGVVVGDFADTLFRAAAFARVAAAGRVQRGPEEAADGSSYASDVSASRLLTLSDQLERAAHLELDRHVAADAA